jgi:hypothetical protein
VNNGADLSARNNNGTDAVYWAMREHNHRVHSMPFAVLSCNTDSKNVPIDQIVTQATVDAHIHEFKQIHAFIDKYHTITRYALSEDVVVDKRVGLGDNGLDNRPLEQVLLYLGMSMDKDQTVNTSIDGETVMRALIPGHPPNANLWYKLYKRVRILHVQVYELANSNEDKYVELRAVLDAHPDVDVNLHQGKTGRRSLHATARRGHAVSTRLLINANADLEARDEKGCTPLNLASISGNRDCFQILIESKADVKTVTDIGTTPAIITAIYGHSECLELLINANADVNASNEYGCTPAMYACQEDRLA